MLNEHRESRVRRHLHQCHQWSVDPVQVHDDTLDHHSSVLDPIDRCRRRPNCSPDRRHRTDPRRNSLGYQSIVVDGVVVATIVVSKCWQRFCYLVNSVNYQFSPDTVHHPQKKNFSKSFAQSMFTFLFHGTNTNIQNPQCSVDFFLYLFGNQGVMRKMGLVYVIKYCCVSCLQYICTYMKFSKLFLIIFAKKNLNSFFVHYLSHY